MRVIICGSRNWPDRSDCTLVINQEIDRLICAVGLARLVIIHGAARGVDSIAAERARLSGIEVRAFPALWGKHGRAAGPIRNQHMLDEGKAEAVSAFFWQDDSPGTQDMVDRGVRKLGSAVRVYRRGHGWMM